MDKFYIKQNSNWPSLTATLKQADGNPIPLVNAQEVKFFMSRKNGNPKIDGGACAILEEDGENEGRIRYEWQNGDTDTRGEYWAEFEIIFADGKRQKVPSKDYNEIVIGQKLGQ